VQLLLSTLSDFVVIANKIKLSKVVGTTMIDFWFELKDNYEIHYKPKTSSITIIEKIH
jgi:hypothetical protein